jgi:hypothetical protein
VLTSLNWTRPRSPRLETARRADSAGMMSCTSCIVSDLIRSMGGQQPPPLNIAGHTPVCRKTLCGWGLEASGWWACLLRWVAGVSREAVHPVACRWWWRLLVSQEVTTNLNFVLPTIEVRT